MATPAQALFQDPGFRKLSPEAQRIVIGKKDPGFASLSQQAQDIVLKKLSGGTGAVDFTSWSAGAPPEPPEFAERMAALATESKADLQRRHPILETREREAAQSTHPWARWLKEKGFGPQNIEEAARKGFLNVAEMPKGMWEAATMPPQDAEEASVYSAGGAMPGQTGQTALFAHRMGKGFVELVEERSKQAARGDVGGALMTTGTEIAATAVGGKVAGKTARAGREAWMEHQVKTIAKRAGITPETVAAERTKAQAAAESKIADIEAKQEAAHRRLEQANRRLADLETRKGVAQDAIVKAREAAARAKEDALANLDLKKEALHEAVAAEQKALQAKHDALKQSIAEVQKKFSPEKMQEVQNLKPQAQGLQARIKEAVKSIREKFGQEYGEFFKELGDPDVEAFADEVTAASDKYGLRQSEKPAALRWAEEVPERVGLEEASVFRGMRGDAVSDALSAMKTFAEKNKLLKNLVDDGALTPDEALDYAKGRVPKMGAEGPQAGWTLADVKHMKTALGRTLERSDLTNEVRAAVREAYQILDERMKDTVAKADPDGAKGLSSKYDELSTRYAKFQQDFYKKDSPLRLIDRAKDAAGVLRPFMGSKGARAMQILRENGIDASILRDLPANHELRRMLELEAEIARIGEERTAQAGVEQKVPAQTREAAAGERPKGIREQTAPSRLAEIEAEKRQVEARRTTGTPREQGARELLRRLESAKKTTIENRDAIIEGLEDAGIEKAMTAQKIPTDRAIRAQLLDDFLNEKKPLFHAYGGISASGHGWTGISPNLRVFRDWLAQRRLRKSPAIRERIVSGRINLGEPPPPPR